MDSIIFLIFVLGLFVGSFLNVVVLRYNTGLSSISGRSMCPKCRRVLKWYELIPVLSFFIQMGKCRSCKSKISFEYPLVEILTGFIFVIVFVRQFNLWPMYSVFLHGLAYSALFFLYYIIIFSILLIISIYDIRHKIIINELVWVFIVLSLFKLGLFFSLAGTSISLENTLNIFSPLILFLPVVILWTVSRGRWIGFGDAKLFFGVGALLGFVSGLSVFILSFWIGALWGLSALLFNKISGNSVLSLKSEVPFAPFIVLATILIFLTKVDLLGLSKILGF